MFILYLTGALLCFSLWLIAEDASSRRVVRMGLGCLAMAAVAVLAYSFARFAPVIESEGIRSSLRLAEQLMSRGDTQRVQQAIHAYNRTASSASTYQASSELWHVLNHGPRAADPLQPPLVAR